MQDESIKLVNLHTLEPNLATSQIQILVNSDTNTPYALKISQMQPV